MSDNGGDKLALGFIGLGIMGTPMAGRLLDAGYEVAVWNRTAAKAEALAARGATAADTPAAVARAADIVMLCVTDTAAVEAVALGRVTELTAASRSNCRPVAVHSGSDPVLTRTIRRPPASTT